MRYITVCIGLMISGQLIAMETPEEDTPVFQSPSPSSLENSLSPQHIRNDILFKSPSSIANQRIVIDLPTDKCFVQIDQEAPQLNLQDSSKNMDLAKLLVKRDIAHYKSKNSYHKMKYAKHKAQNKKEKLRLLLVKEMIGEGKEDALKMIFDKLF